MNENEMIRTPNGLKRWDFVKRAIENHDELVDFIAEWREVIKGGDRIETLEPWARQFVEAADKLLVQAARH